MRLYKILNIISSRIFGLLAVMMALVAAIGCDDDNTTLTPLGKSEMTLQNVTYSTLTFNWEKVEGARQYFYKLVKSGSTDIINSALTKDTQVAFTGLEPDTEYTLTVVAYAAMNSDNTTSDPIELTARTSALIVLQSPVAQWSREVNTIIADWTSVEGARDYIYTLTDENGNKIKIDTTYATSISFSQMSTGKYILSVVAKAAQEGYSDSEPGKLMIDFVREREELWHAQGSYSSGLLGKGWSADLVAYDDNSYELLAWYGAEGYNLEFSIDEEDAGNMFKIGGAYVYDKATDTYAVPTGYADMPMVYVHASGNQSAFEGSAGSGGITIAVSDGKSSTTDSFSWGVKLEDYVGEWQLSFLGLDALGEEDYDQSYEGAANITLGAEPNTLVIPLPNYYGYIIGTATIEVDITTMTFTMAPVKFGDESWILAGSESDTSNASGKISKDKIEFTDFQTWYQSYDYIDLDGSHFIYTR